MRVAVASRTPASAAIGMYASNDVPTAAMARIASDCTMAARRVRAPETCARVERASTLITGMPESAAVAMFARPWPTSSWSTLVDSSPRSLSSAVIASSDWSEAIA